MVIKKAPAFGGAGQFRFLAHVLEQIESFYLKALPSKPLSYDNIIITAHKKSIHKIYEPFIKEGLWHFLVFCSRQKSKGKVYSW